MVEEPQHDKGGWLPAGPDSVLIDIHPNEHIVKPDPSGAWLCVRAEHKDSDHECSNSWWDHQLNVCRKIHHT